MRRFAFLVGSVMFLFPVSALAASSSPVDQFTSSTMPSVIGLAATACTFFLVRAGYMYMTATGNPTKLMDAKRAIKQALIGLCLVIGAGVLTALLTGALSSTGSGSGATPLSLTPIQPASQDGTLSQVLLDAISGFLQNIVQSATSPIMHAITGFLTTTPLLASNSVVFNFWLVVVAIADSLFVLVIVLIGFQVMAASSLGFAEISLKALMPKIALAFIAANTSIFLIDWLLQLSQVMIQTVLQATGGIGNAWILNAFDPTSLASGSTLIITLIFMVVFIVLAAVLVLFYISRLMMLAFGAVISPVVCLLWLVPGLSGVATGALKSYLVTIFTLFVHVVIIQLASSFLTVPGQTGSNPLISVLIGIAMLSVLLKGSATATQLVLTSQATSMVSKIGGQIMNVVGADQGVSK